MAKYFRNHEGEVYESYSGAPFQASDAPVSKKEGDAARVEQAKKHLREILKPGATVYTILNHCSASGMSRSISLAIGGEKGEITKLDYWVAQVRGEHIDQKHGGLKVSGCGMDMGFHLVYGLGRILWPEGTPEPHSTRNGAPDRDGGYALKQEWL
jgi:hypothetical protein